MSGKTLINTAHQGGNTAIAFSRDGAHIYTGGSDSLVRLWTAELGTDQEPSVALEAMEGITCLATGSNSWLSGSEDSEVRQYVSGKPDLEALITSAIGVPIRSIAVDPRSSRVAVASDDPPIKVIDLADTTKMMVLKGHSKAVRRVSWHPSGTLLTSCGADGKIIVWDVSGEEPKEVEVIQGVLPAVSDPDTPEWRHDCTAVWHTSGEYFFITTRAHEIVTISRSNWSKATTFSDDACSGAITALAMSTNGVYLASASKTGLYIWATQNRRLVYSFQEALKAPITQMAWSPTQNLLAWTDDEGVLTRWQGCIPPDGLDPVKLSSIASRALPVATKRKDPTGLFDIDAEEGDETTGAPDVDMDEDDGGVTVDLDNDDWILDDLGDGSYGKDDKEKEKEKVFSGTGVREMVSVTKAQPPFQPGSTPMDNKKRYLAYNMVGVIEVTDQDTHHVVNVEFHDRSLRKGYHFTDHFKYELAALGERGAVYACQPEAEHPAHVIYKPYGTWASQSEWTYELPPKVTVLGVAAGGAAPSKSLRAANDADIQGQGTVVIATSEHELIFLTGSGIERHVLSLQGDFVSMVAGQEWVFVVHREGSTTLDGSQNLTGRLIRFEDFCLLQKDSLPIPKGHTLKWLGITEEGVPALYDSSGILNILPRFRIPFQATWMRLLDTNTLERRQGKIESYWPVGVTGDTFMCLILKGRQEHPGFPRPLIQELPCRLPFKRTDAKESSLEEHFARETMLLDIIRDGLADDELTTDDISRRELALDKEIIQLIQMACKNDKPGRAIDLTKLLHHNASFDMAIKVAGFYHLIGLQEKMGMLKDDRDDVDRLVVARDRRREREADFAAVPAPRLQVAESSKPKAFQDFRPPPTIHRPGLERVNGDTLKTSQPPRASTSSATPYDRDEFQSSAADFGDEYIDQPSPDGKRKRSVEPPIDVENGKRRMVESTGQPITAYVYPGSNPFARKSGAANDRNPFNRNSEMNRSLHKSESFFNKVDSAEADKKRGTLAKGKAKEKKDIARQMTLDGKPMPEKPKKIVTKKKKDTEEDSQTPPVENSAGGDTQVDTQETETTMVVDSQETTPAPEEPTQVDQADEDEPIEWPDSPEPATRQLDSISVS
ncbi:hypothetical protein BDW22DRAFT_1331357 [Trametopsis cervina]|nr:hypothetical protein BDW22DRAFT_1331357 [Trametopsis cervina]